jgi:hypothetical protein
VRRDAIEISGPLTPATRDLFRRLEPSVETFDPEISSGITSSVS